MNINEETTRKFSVLNEVKLSLEDKNDILKNLRREMAAKKPRRNLTVGVLPGVAAAVAAVAVVVAGVDFELHRPAQMTSTNYATATNKTPSHHINPSNNQTSPKQPATQGIVTHSYNSPSTAAAVITKLENHFGVLHPSGPAVDLGTGIKAAFNGGAGQYQYQWHEGNWTIDMLGFGDASKGKQVAKNVVAYLHTHMLPPPKNKGVIIMTGSASGATWSTDVAWQEGSKVSQLKQSGNPVNVLAVVVNENSHASTSSQSTSFSQTFKNHGGAYEVYLTPSVGFKMKNLGGGASNFHYQFSKTVDAGKTWTKISTHRFSHVNGVSFVDKDTGYLLNNSPATSVSPDLFVTHDGGVKWTKQKLPIPSSYKNDYRHSSYPIFFSKQIGFIPIYGQSMNSSGKTQFLYMLVSKDGGASWKAYTTHQGSGLTWTLKRQKLAVSYGKQTITVSGLFGVWSVSP